MENKKLRRMKKKGIKKSEGLFLIANILLGIFAFAFIMNVEVVRGQADGVGSNGDEEGKVEDQNGIGNKGGKTGEEKGSKKFKIGNFTKSASYITGGLALGQIIKELAGDEPWGDALGNALGVAGGVSGFSSLFPEKTFLGGNAHLLGVGAGILTFILTYKKIEYETVFFTCQPWEAPIGGNDCEKCNDGVHPCSEYRCKSLGQACDLVNKGTEKELCVWTNPRDVNSPSIRPLESALSPGYRYVPLGARPPNWGTQIKPLGDDCIPPFTPIQFGIQTDKPSQCKIDFLILGGAGDVDVKPKGYDDMKFFFGMSNLYDYNHIQSLSLPSPNTINKVDELRQNETGGLEIQNDGIYNLYVRCRSANGFYNADPYKINFCVQKGPDLTPPEIVETSIRNGQPINFEADNVTLSVFTNEPVNCKWSRDNDLSFESMNNEMICANNLQDIRNNMLYECRTRLTGIKDRQDNLFYFRCEDQPWESPSNRNKMSRGYQFVLKGTQPLNIKQDSIKPISGSILTGATSTIPITLEVETQNGFNEGESVCLYSLNNETFIRFFETNSFKHKQTQDLTQGEYTYYIRCVDLGGNQDYGITTFSVFVDTQAPLITRVLNDNNKLKIITDEEAVCRYTNDINTRCNFDINEGEGNPMQYPSQNQRKEHLAMWNTKETYYIKCMDINNRQPNPTECSIIVRPVELRE
ncbi:MAG: hypothetical protein QW727_00820 [Candidatus Pacearchaeota archaeon]